MLRLAMLVASIIIVLSALYLGWELVAGYRQVRRAGTRLGAQGRLSFGSPHLPPPAPGWFVYYMVPALNEGAVIARTVGGLVGGAESHLIVIDDGSEDGTGSIAAEAGGAATTVLRREMPAARRGKGAALNAGYRWLVEDVAARGLDRHRVIVCVVDADGRLSDGALAATLAAFDDKRVGAVQLAVRIRNRGRFLTTYQDYLFWSLAAVTQFGRMSTGSVSLGGNGQFTRLSALATLGDEPWNESLTEDLDLGLRLALHGWVATSAPGAAVDQQAVGSLRRLVRQRTRWYQGHMTAGRRIPEIWRADGIPHLRALELISYLLCPWILDLPWTILFHVCVVGMVTGQTGNLLPASGVLGVPLSVLFWYLLSFFPSIVCGFLYRTRDGDIGVLRSMVFSHAVVFMNYVSFVCVWRAFVRILRGRTGWAKTQREAEVGAPMPLPVAVRAALSVAPAPVPVAAGWEPPFPPSRRSDVRQAVAVAWEELAEVASGRLERSPGLDASVRLLAGAGADGRLAGLFAPWPGRPATSYSVSSFRTGDPEPETVKVAATPSEALSLLQDIPRGTPAALAARHDSLERLVVSVDGEGVLRFAPPNVIALDGPLASPAAAAWTRALALVEPVVLKPRPALPDADANRELAAVGGRAEAARPAPTPVVVGRWLLPIDLENPFPPTGTEGGW